MPDDYSIRLALPADAATIAAHRVGMFRDMHRVTPASMEPLREASRTWLGPAIARGEYVGWLAVAADGSVVAGAGVQRRQVLPFPRANGDGSVSVVAGRSAVVVNVYTDPAHRRRGLARRLMEQVLVWADTELEDLVLHAAPDGLHLYESLGFAATNEMRYRGALGSGSQRSQPTQESEASPVVFSRQV